MDTPDFGAIGTDAHSLFNLINEQMNTVAVDDPRWHELYDMFRLVSVVCSLASAACTRQAERDQADEPVPYALADCEPAHVSWASHEYGFSGTDQP